MNTKMKWTQLIGAAILVALTSVFVTGPVAAVPGIPLRVVRVVADTPPAVTNESSWVRFEQYLVASSPEEYPSSVRIPASKVDSWVRFEQYMAASSPEEYPSSVRIPASKVDSWARFEQYMAASSPEDYKPTASNPATEESGSAHLASPMPIIVTDDSWARFEMYLEHSQ